MEFFPFGAWPFAQEHPREILNGFGMSIFPVAVDLDFQRLDENGNVQVHSRNSLTRQNQQMASDSFSSR
ncbi:hypothetical protein LPU83_1545 [Rhizobium favelukesii]|uniref:Uncharacterized protein n=1 Tax=Rhizobium favelukesii TaxID=348824 RepID=W6R7E9_9HYPH|nr:hypothetical protein LPU83_1545 [Rhizobium favelukesii]